VLWQEKQLLSLPASGSLLQTLTFPALRLHMRDLGDSHWRGCRSLLCIGRITELQYSPTTLRRVFIHDASDHSAVLSSRLPFLCHWNFMDLKGVDHPPQNTLRLLVMLRTFVYVSVESRAWRVLHRRNNQLRTFYGSFLAEWRPFLTVSVMPNPQNKC